MVTEGVLPESGSEALTPPTPVGSLSGLLNKRLKAVNPLVWQMRVAIPAHQPL